MIKTEHFGTTEDGREVLAFTLEDGGRRAVVLNLGGAVQSVLVPDREGKLTDVVLGYTDARSYEKNRGFLGAVVGRFANRIKAGKFTLDGTEYQLALTDRGNHHHGGPVGFNRRLFSHEVEGDVLRLSYFSPDGEMNYPGNLKTEVEYSFRGGELTIRYRAETDKKTIVNLTNHSYFNLNGEGSGDVLSQLLEIDADEMIPTDGTMIPSGGLRAVKGTPFDFTSQKPIGRDIGAADEDLLRGNGYDHCFLLRGRGSFARCARAVGDRTGITMTCFTDMPAVQLYSGNGLKVEGKHGYYGSRTGFCLETQFIPNNVNAPEYAAYGSSVLSPGEIYEHRTVYRFEA